MDISNLQLQEMDYVLTSSHNPISLAIRAREAGILNTFKGSIATHVGLLLEFKNSYIIAEMLGKGLSFSSLNKYSKDKFFCPKILMIRRNHVYDNYETRFQTASKIYSMFQKGIKYDYKGIVEFIMPFLKDSEEKFYCSELLNYFAMMDGNPIVSFDEDDCTPWQIQVSDKLDTVYDFRACR